MKYRPDIDGLRALAVLLVVAFHIHVPGLRAGFIGVDIFFVISGYLITVLLAEELRATGTLGLGEFYARRIRRLAPAICLVLASVMLFSLFLLHPFGQQQQLYRSTIAASLFVSNIYFAQTTGGYFATPMDKFYLLHFWSLSVEEQFYIFWPLIMLAAGRSSLAARFGRIRVLFVVAAALSAFSFAWALHLVSREDHAAYFLMPTRAWQILCGAMTALALLRRNKLLSLSSCFVIQVSALLLLGAGLWWIDGPSRHPGLPALLPTAAAVLFVVGGSGARNPVQSVLSVEPVVALGKLSFSWYLWHWPLIAVGRSRFFDTIGIGQDVIAALISLPLAWLTFHYVEEPFRRRLGATLPVRRIIALGLGGAVSIVLLAGGLGFTARHSNLAEPWWFIDPRLEHARFTRNALRKSCHQEVPFQGLAPLENCVAGAPGKPIRVLLFGDSHADHLAPLMTAYGRSRGIGVVQRSFSACRPALGTYGYLDSRTAEHCRAFHDKVLEEAALLAANGLKGVILSGYWWGEFHVTAMDGASRLNMGLARTVDRFRDLGLNVLLVGPIPFLPFNAVECVARLPDVRCGLLRTEWDIVRAPVLEIMHAVAGSRDDVRVLDPSDFFCSGELCRVGDEAMLFFRDQNHLTPDASEALLPISQSQLDWVSGLPTPVSAAGAPTRTPAAAGSS